jgi:hypothetical protein
LIIIVAAVAEQLLRECDNLHCLILVWPVG